MKRIIGIFMTCAGMVLLALTPSLHAQRVTLQVTPLNFVGGCPANLALTVSLSAPAPPQVLMQFGGNPNLNPAYWLGGGIQIPLQTSTPFTLTTGTSSSGWVQADVVTFKAGNPQPIIVSTSNRVNYSIRCIPGVPAGDPALPPPYTQRNGTSQPLTLNSAVPPRPQIPSPASQPPQTGPSVPPPTPPSYTTQNLQSANVAQRYSLNGSAQHYTTGTGMPNAPSQNASAQPMVRPSAPVMQGAGGGTVNGIRVTMKVGAGRCVPGNPIREHFTGSLYIGGNGPVSALIQYRWIRSDGAMGQLISANATSSRELNLTDEWDITRPMASGWEAVQVVSINGQAASIQSNHAAFACSGAGAVQH